MRPSILLLVLAVWDGPAVPASPKPGAAEPTAPMVMPTDAELMARLGFREERLETAPEPAAILGQVSLAMGVQPGPDLEARVLSALAGGPALRVARSTGDDLRAAITNENLGDIALEEGEAERAAAGFADALALYPRIAEPYSIGWALVRLARLADGAERQSLVTEARAAIDRPDLVATLERKFGAVDNQE